MAPGGCRARDRPQLGPMKRWTKLAMAAGGLGAGALALPRLRARSLPLPLVHPGVAVPYAGLTETLPIELDQPARVDGTLPAGLLGTLYINGPGRFDRGGKRKRNLLDGDGLITAFTLRDGAVRARARFVQTDKYREEDALDRFLYATWTTQRPGGLFANLGNRTHPRGQAGVTVKRWDDRLFAFDEGAQPWELDPESLDTREYATLGLREGEARHAAHAKVDPIAREWIHFGLEYGRRTQLHLTTFGEGMELRAHRVEPLDGAPYMHDFAVTAGHIVLVRHPADAAPLPFIAGLTSFKDSMRWRPERGNQLLVFERGRNAAPLRLETEAAWMWHTLNAHDRGSETVIDFVGYDHPDHFLGAHAALTSVMTGGAVGFQHPGKIRRYVIDRERKTVRQEILDGGHHDFPTIDPRWSTRRHRFGYFAAGRGSDWLMSTIVRKDMETGQTESHDFGDTQYCLEPIFAARPGPRATEATESEPGWLLVLVYDGKRNASRLAVLDAEHLADGPVAEAHLDQPLPFRFHGTWWPTT
jgi:all-trans-8'-apo-beta-carotenal 15,15'-oxygenase